MSPEREPYPDLTHIYGKVIADPRTVPYKDGEFTSVPVSVTYQYGGENFAGTRVIEVTSGKEPLKSKLLNAGKGYYIAAEGNLRERQYEGKTRYSLTAFKAGRVVDFDTAGDDF